MKQNLYAFLQIYVDLNMSFIFFTKFVIIKYILVFFFWVTLSLFIYFGPKLDFPLIKFTLISIHISYHLIHYPQ